MAEKLLNFIYGSSNLDDEKHIMYHVWKQNPDYEAFVIDFDDILEWVRKMNPKVKFDEFDMRTTIMEINTKQVGNPYKVFKYNKTHMSVMYYNGKTIETYETALWQHTANNCSLYTGLVLILRSLVKDMDEMFDILRLVEDIEGSESCRRLAAISKYYFDRGIDMFRFRFGKIPPSILNVNHEYTKTLYVFFHGLNPYGALYCESNTRHFKQMKGRDFRLYNRSLNEPRKELYYFIDWLNIMKRHYTKFVLIGHSYGSVFANYFAQYMIDNDVELNADNVISISLDGSELIDTCEYVAYEVLAIDRSNKIEYLQHTAMCAGRDIIEEWNKRQQKQFEEEFGVDIIECNAIQWYRSVKACNDLQLNHRHVRFWFAPNSEAPNIVSVKRGSDKSNDMNLYEIQYGKTYDHALFTNEPVSKAIMDIIDNLINVN